MKTDVTEDVIREVALPMGWVDVKVCAVDETWSGLKLMVRRSERDAPARPARCPDAPARSGPRPGRSAGVQDPDAPPVRLLGRRVDGDGQRRNHRHGAQLGDPRGRRAAPSTSTGSRAARCRTPGRASTPTTSARASGGRTGSGSGGDVLHLRGGLRDGRMVLEGEAKDPAGKLLRQRVSWIPQPDGRAPSALGDERGRRSHLGGLVRRAARPDPVTGRPGAETRPRPRR